MYNILTDEEVARLFLLFKDQQNTFIQKVMKALPDLIYVMNLDTRDIIYSSRLIALEIGYSPKAVEEMKHPILDIMHPSDVEMFMQHLRDIKNSKPGEVLAVEFRLIRQDGKIVWFVDRNTIFTRNVNGAAVTKIGITHEITERKHYEEQLLTHKKIIEQSEALAGSGSWAFDRDSRAFSWSPGMYTLFNLPLGTAVRPSIYKDYCVTGDAPIAEKIVRLIETGKDGFEDILRIQSNGTVRRLKIKAGPVEHHLTGSRQMVGVDLDITLTEQKEKQLRKLNKELAAKNRDIQYLHADLKTFAQITATDYQANFRTIYTAFESLLEHEAGKFSNNGRGTLRKIQASLQRMNLLTDDILGYLTITKENSHVTTVSLDQVVGHVIADLKGQLEIAEIVTNVGHLGAVVGDRYLIYVLFRNIIDNAIKFRKDGVKSVITVTSNATELMNDEKGGTTGKVMLAVSVEDNGIGFDAANSEKIFDLFYKNHYDRKLKGSGVGLAIARKIMNIHNGYITAEGSVNMGAKFICHFPANVLDGN